MKLTDNEKRDILEHLDAGKDLPEKYHFLLFEDKGEDVGAGYQNRKR